MSDVMLGIRKMRSDLKREHEDNLLPLESSILSRKGHRKNAVIAYAYKADHGGRILCLRHWGTDLVKIDVDLGLLRFAETSPTVSSMRNLNAWFPKVVRDALGVPIAAASCKGRLELFVLDDSRRSAPVPEDKWFDPCALLGLNRSMKWRDDGRSY